ncbi:glutathione S-transferase family protein [Rhizobium alvei]|uniref:Glutathione S-transferase n=1 Tax=Rhizobium alvei TaxID=1132659 RepID=A0ABT8YKM9_9HYPH|nr:glutathione S-transferase [Rhizobium alvei]MDO6963908.1 glutathione S-transferase [Rhizobium alvei]
MKLYDSDWAPNPRRVRLFLAEKNMHVDRVDVDLKTLKHKTPEFSEINALQRVPVLELDDGTRISESVAICRYLEEIQPDPPLFGRDAREKALVEMWNRRVELNFFASVAAAFRHLHPAMAAAEVPQVKDWGEANKIKAMEALAFLDQALADRPFLTGDAFSIADITLLVAYDFMKPARLKCPDELENIRRWYDAVSQRPSAGVQ